MGVQNYSHLNFVTFSGIMSTVLSQQPPKEDEEEDDEEQGEEFVFEDSTDEEKLQEDSKGISLDCVSSVHMSKKVDIEASDSVSQTVKDKTQLPKISPPAGQEGNPTKDLSISAAGNTFSGIIFF